MFLFKKLIHFLLIEVYHSLILKQRPVLGFLLCPNLYQVNSLFANLLDKRSAVHLNITLIEDIAGYTLRSAVVFAESGGHISS